MSPTQVTFSLLCGIRPRAFYAAAHAVNDSLDLTINSALATGRASMDRLANSFRVLIKRENFPGAFLQHFWFNDGIVERGIGGKDSPSL